MPENAPARQAAAPQAQRPWQETAKSLVQTVGTFILIQTVMKYGMSYLGMSQTASPAPAVSSNVGAAVEADGTAAVAGAASAVASQNIAKAAWDLGTPLSMFLFLSTSNDETALDYSSPLAIWDGLTFGNYKDSREEDFILDVPEVVIAQNGSWWMDILLVKGGGETLVGKTVTEVAHHRKELTRWMPKRRVRKEKKLIGGEEDEEEEEDAELPAQSIVSYWAPNLTLTIVSDAAPVGLNTIQPQMAPFYHLVPIAEDAEDKTKTYFPPIFPNDFWLLKENLIQINETTAKLPLRVSYHAISNLKFQIFSSMTASFEQAAQQQGSGAELDEVKRMLTETNPILLATTLIVTLLHTVFEFLAFSSDVSHWRKKDKDLVGVSLRTILVNCFVQLVILLYLQDSSEETSFMILFGQGIGLLIEAWKITKVVDIRIRPAPDSIFGYQILFEDKHELTEEEKKTQEYDKLAFKIVSYFAFPLLAGYTVYSLLYQTHRGWYSFIVTTLAQAIYMFGFVQLIPQLIINYKLKSVAHMPMKAMVYKTLSTVVDDFFAFCIKMPWLHRLACFRDDVVFLILLYQRWIYRIDYSRVNEYGQVTEGKVDAVTAVTGEKDKVESKKDK